MRIVVTGVDGFVGRHVARAAHARGHAVLGVTRGPELATELSSLLAEHRAADLREQWPSMGRVDAVIHLAGLAAVGPSFDHPQAYLESNSAMVTVMGEALLNAQRDSSAPVRVVGASTGGVYRAPEGDEALDEEAPTSSTSPYVVSKLLVESQLAYYSQRGLDTIVARPFNHIGPGQSAGFLVPDLFKALSSLSPGQVLRTGDLSTRRDYTDVRDVADAYLVLAEARQHAHTVYNISSGRSRSGEEILEALALAMDVDVPLREVDPSRLRPQDPRQITGSASRLATEFGWRPVRAIADSIADYVRDARARE